MNWWTEFFQGSTFLDYLNFIAVLAASIGAIHFTRNRWKTEQEKVRLELFEKRYKVFESTANLISIARSRKFEEQTQVILAFQDTPRLARFLFSKEVSEFLDEVWETVCDLQDAQSELDDTISPISKAIEENADVRSLQKRKRDIDRESRLIFSRLYPTFEPYLNFANSKEN